jgi:hypothetical protein
MAKVFDTLPAIAVSVAGWLVATEDTVAVNDVLVAFAGTVTLAGAATAALLLTTLTTKPPVVAALVSVTVHTSVPEPVREEVMHESPLSAAGTGVPLPLRAINVDAPADESLFTVS